MIKSHQNLKFLRNAILALTFMMFSGVTFLFAFGRSEGTIDSVVGNFIANAFQVFAFPTLFIFDWLGIMDATLYTFGLILNSIMYAIIINGFFQFLKKRNKAKYTS